MTERTQIWMAIAGIIILAGILGFDQHQVYRQGTEAARMANEQAAARTQAIREQRREQEQLRAEWVEAYTGRFENPERWEEIRAREMESETAKRGRAVAQAKIGLHTNASTAQEAR